MDEGAHRRRAAMEALLAAAPSATAASMMVDEDEGPFVRAGGLARHLIEALRRDDASEVSAVFGTAEVLLTEGDPDVTNLIQIGFFEAIQNVVGNLHADGVAV